MARLLSVNVGLPRDIDWDGRTVRTAIWKNAVVGPRMVRRLNIDGDGQGDLAGHGGEHRAVFVYQIAAYRYWARELHRDDFVMGQFGENFTVDGMADDEVCIGDRYRIGDALFEVTQPRVTCYRVGIRMNEPRMAALLVAHGKPGFYFRVLEEGFVKAGDAIEKVTDGPERLTVADASALLYLPGHGRAQLERALRINALSPGWRGSFEALLEHGAGGGGNPGLAQGDAAPVAWDGFRPARIAALTHETSSVIALELEAAGDAALATPLPGQFIVVRLRPHAEAPPVIRSFSLCGIPNASRYRLGIKCETHGAASPYFMERARLGDEIQISAPRGAFVLRPGEGPVVLLSAGIGATPVLAMLHALAAERSSREVWWLYGARNRTEHPFADEVRGLIGDLVHGRAHVSYSRPAANDVLGGDFQSVGHLDVDLFASLGVPREGDFYLCGPTAFLDEMRIALAAWGVAPARINSELFGSEPSQTPGIVGGTQRTPHVPPGTRGTGPVVSFARSSLAVPWDPMYRSLLELAEACDVPTRWSCRTGVCHTCESGLLSGSVRYEPDPLDAPALGRVLICCSQPQADVVVDI